MIPSLFSLYIGLKLLIWGLPAMCGVGSLKPVIYHLSATVQLNERVEVRDVFVEEGG